MKKYKVLTNRLKWFKIHKDDILIFTDRDIFIQHGKNDPLVKPEKYYKIISDCIIENNDWFEEIKEKQKSDWIVRFRTKCNYGQTKYLSFSTVLRNLTEKEMEKYAEDELIVSYEKFEKSMDIKYYTEEDMRDCFDESRKTYPIIGFKHINFEDYLKSKNNE